MAVNRDKTVLGLSLCGKGPHYCAMAECPYYDDRNCEYKVMHDALALVAELTPRMLSLQEACETDECWFECINGAKGYADILPGDTKDLLVYRLTAPVGTVSSEEYGRTWRCWSHRPTDKQRKEAKWDG